MSELWGSHISGARQQDPFGRLPNQIAGGAYQNFIRPQMSLLGFGAPAGSKRAQHQQELLAGGTGPLADLIRQERDMAPGIVPGMQQIGNEVASRGSQAYTTLQGQLNNYLSQILPESLAGTRTGMGAVQGGMDAARQGIAGANEAFGVGREGVGYAQQLAKEAFDPTTSSALYQHGAQNYLQAVRPGEAARGMLSAGASGQAESRQLSDMAFQAAQQRQAQEQAATQLLGQSAGNLGGLAANIGQQGTNLAGMGTQMGGLAAMLGQLGQSGIQAGQTGMEGVNALGALLSQQYNLPLQGASNLTNLLSGGLTPAQNFLGMTSPQFTQFSGKAPNGLGMLSGGSRQTG